jgi:hypothetical protein
MRSLRSRCRKHRSESAGTTATISVFAHEFRTLREILEGCYWLNLRIAEQ